MGSMGDVLHFLNAEPSKFCDHQKLTKNMFSFYLLTRKEVETLRQKYKEIVEQEDEEMDRKRKLLRSKSNVNN